MNWFFVNAGQQAGPISDIQLDEYILGGKILPDTLIWREGLESWVPCKDARPNLAFKGRPSAVTVAQSPSRDDTTVEIVCSECGAWQTRDNAVKQGDAWICAACKPIHIQKIKEGVVSTASTHSMEFAGIGPRALAKFLDLLIIGLPAGFLIGLILAFGLPSIARSRASAEATLLTMLVAILVVALATISYQVWCLVKHGATPGKRILRLRVVTGDGGDISVGRAIGRFLGEWVNGMIPFWIGYIIAAFDSERRTVHDHIAGTRVIKV